jgi:hypothetical protein
MEQFLATETLIIELLLIVSLVAIAVRRLRVPYTVALVVVGLLITFQQPLEVVLTPELILALFVPPLIFEAAFHWCAAGGPALYLAQQTGCRVIGIDPSVDNVRRARAAAAAHHSQSLRPRPDYAHETIFLHQAPAGGAAVALVSIAVCIKNEMALIDESPPWRHSSVSIFSQNAVEWWRAYYHVGRSRRQARSATHQPRSPGDIAHSGHLAQLASQTFDYGSGTHYGGTLTDFYHYWYRYHPRFW